MIPTISRPTAVTLAAICGALLCAAVIAADSDSPHDWLARMTSAVQTTDYEGTVIRISNGRAEALKVAHTITDGVVRERIVSQEGEGLEIIRNGNEVYCILPDKQRVLVEEWNDQSTLFSTLPSTELRIGAEYDVLITDEDRVAGRRTVVLAIRPHDEFRYGHRLWLDLDTGFPLQTQMVDGNSEPLEQVKFADIRLNHEIHASAFESSYSTENFRWFTVPGKALKTDVDTDWISHDLPIGFEIVAVHVESLEGSAEPVTHIMYSDGLASVSVFVTDAPSGDITERSSIGASHSYSTVVDDHRITAVGDVPAATVERVATSMQQR